MGKCELRKFAFLCYTWCLCCRASLSKKYNFVFLSLFCFKIKKTIRFHDNLEEVIAGTCPGIFLQGAWRSYKTLDQQLKIYYFLQWKNKLNNYRVYFLGNCRYYCLKSAVNFPYHAPSPRDTGHKLNVQMMLRSCSRRLRNVLCTLNLRPVSNGTISDISHNSWVGIIFWEMATFFTEKTNQFLKTFSLKMWNNLPH